MDYIQRNEILYILHRLRHPKPRGTEETTGKFVTLDKRSRTYTARLQSDSVILNLPDVGLSGMDFNKTAN